MLNIINFVDKDVIEAIQIVFLETIKLRKNIKDKNFNLIFINDEVMKEFNKKYRNKNTSTDVLAFYYNELELEGEIFISLQRAKQQAKDLNHSLKREICFLFLHGMLHLLGFNHDKLEKEKEMIKIQGKILNKIGIIK